MKRYLTVGAVPTLQDVSPQEEGWREVREISLCDGDTPATIGLRTRSRHRQEGRHPGQQGS
jgi:hypothetical protein